MNRLLYLLWLLLVVAVAFTAVQLFVLGHHAWGIAGMVAALVAALALAVGGD